MKFLLITFATIILLASFCYALNFGISPEKIEFDGKINEFICRNFSLFEESNQAVFEGSIKWNADYSREIFDYSVLSPMLKINYSFPEIIGSGEYEICLKAEKAGVYYGTLMYKLRDSSYGIGTWIELHASNTAPQGISFLSGKAVQENNFMKSGLISVSLILTITLLILIIKLKKKNLAKL
jgi:hypothetical protein